MWILNVKRGRKNKKIQKNFFINLRMAQPSHLYILYSFNADIRQKLFLIENKKIRTY